MTGHDSVLVRAGSMAATGALALGAATTAIIVESASTYTWLVSRGAFLGLIVLAVGTAFGSERVVALATAPTLGSALLGVTAGGELAWGRSIIIGCLWYASLELAWASIEHRDGTIRTPAVGRSRLQEVATVVIVAVLVAGVGAAASSFAPERTLVVRVLVVSAVLLSVVGALRHLSTTAPAEPG